MDTHYSDRDYLDRLVARLSETCARKGWIPEMMPATSDIDGKWNSLLEGFIGDAVHEFNSYPEVTLAWAGYIGCAAAELWDDDFEAFKALTYDDLKGKRGFDDLDEHVLADVLGMPVGSPQAKELESTLAYCAAEAPCATSLWKTLRPRPTRSSCGPSKRCTASAPPSASPPSATNS